ncbi:hypothetical protein V1512DRAFT_241344 [Lipomyces arxii]|uniref:uncharacterized protein n=1 Tax=Lipomyces arxii TaxID=56418 RepID=UPI0034CFDF0C
MAVETGRRVSQIYQLLSDSPQSSPDEQHIELEAEQADRDNAVSIRERSNSQSWSENGRDNISSNASHGTTTRPMSEIVDLETLPVEQPRAKRRRVIMDAEREDVIEVNDDSDIESIGSEITIESSDEDFDVNLPPIREEKPVVSSTLLSEFTCVICFDQPDILAASPCGHLYCYNCIYRALSSGVKATAVTGECSVCRRKVQYKRILPLEMKVLDDELDENDGPSKEKVAT